MAGRQGGLSHHQLSHIGEHLRGPAAPQVKVTAVLTHLGGQWQPRGHGPPQAPGNSCPAFPRPGQAVRSPTYTQLDSRPRNTQPGPPQWARLQPAPPGSVPSGSPGSTAGSGATRPRPLALRVASGTAVVVPAALSLPGYHTSHSACQGLTKAAGGIEERGPRASSRGQG